VHRNEHAVDIDAPAERVFPYLAQPELMRTWIGGLVEFRPIDEGPALGSRAIQVVEVAGKKWELESELTRYEPPLALEARLVAAKDFELVATYRLEEANGRTRVSATTETAFKHRTARLLGGVLTRKAQKKLEADLARLKLVVESEPG
jgi:uncharacterized protein YndB with AHSA1/START domain